MIFVGPPKTEQANSNSELMITDPLGHQSGLDILKGEILQKIPNASYGKERIDDAETGEHGHESALFEAMTPSNGRYKVEVIGTGSGKYILGVVGYDLNNEVSSQRLEDIIYPGKIDSYEFTYSSIPGSQVQVKHTGSSEIPVFDGKGQKPSDVNKFLQFFSPKQQRTELPVNSQDFNLSIIYGSTVKTATFRAELNGADITIRFDPLPGKSEIISIPLQQGRNVLILSVEGIKESGKTAKDTDRLVFILP